MKAPTIFITGISASGKSTLGKILKENLEENGTHNIIFLDGEAVRMKFKEQGKQFGFSNEERKRFAIEIAHLAVEYNEKGIICIISALCHLKNTRLKMREIIDNIMEVYLDCPVSICAERDYKDQYSKAFQGLISNFIGVTELYQNYENVELVLKTGEKSIKECSKILFDATNIFLNKNVEIIS
jgi:adenylylsulfate kinase